jgi:4-amino-4-deoxy-L-arabinose transferase-like glycosyltransferase
VSLSFPSQLLILVLAWAAIYLPALGTRELQGEEARRILPGRTMVQTGDWTVPRSAGKIYNRKPPLINWTSAWMIRATGGMNEWAMRLPSTLAVLALAVTALLTSRVWLGSAGAFLLAAILLTHIGFIEKGRLAEIEALYFSLFGMGLFLWLGAWWRGRVWMAWLLALPVMGLAFLAKGPLHIWYFYALVVPVLVNEKKLRSLWHPAHGLGWILFVATWLPWAMANSQGNPQKDSGKVWLEQITHRLGLVEFDWVNWFLQVPQCLINFLPWTLVLIWAWHPRTLVAWREMGRLGGWMRALRTGLTLGFLVIALLPSSRPRFMLPLDSAAALLTVGVWMTFSRELHGRWLHGLGLALVTLAAVVLVGSWVVPVVIGGLELLPLGWVALSSMALLAGLGWVLRSLRQGDRWGCLTTRLGVQVMLLVALVVIHGATSLAPLLRLRESLRPFARELVDHVGADTAVVLYKLEERMWPFYLGLRCREIASLEELPSHTDWVMVREGDVVLRRQEMSRRYGEIQQEVLIQEPMTGNAGGKGYRYVLLGFGDRVKK